MRIKIRIRRVWAEFTLGCFVLGYAGVPNMKSVSVSFTPDMMRTVRNTAYFANDIHSYCWGVFRYSNTFAPVCGVDEYEYFEHRECEEKDSALIAEIEEVYYEYYC